ncbi:MAG: hydrogenobyrinic acid a,c-diamide synthase (glutamine-hydrolyzing) [Gammaproteobacteria bacterium]|nr:hydrogenobyrinic acid a,c-diamide synthase (glutamine-hydrolyzing) [Gammaproteobacteria bacterium]
MPYFFISAAHKSSGKTTLSIGLTAAFLARGMSVQTFKKGPDYIDPLWLSAASGRSCRNLDFFTMRRDEILQNFAHFMQHSELGIIEGNKGLYDGLDLEGSNSNAALASLLQAPVILVIDARGMTRGIAPLILGYQSFDPNIRIAGVILNKVGGSRHEEKLRRVIEHYTDVSVVGAVHYAPGLVIDERHLGLLPSNEAEQAREKISNLGDAVASQVDLQRVLEIAGSTSLVLPAENISPDAGRSGKCVRIGYPQDRAFGFYYPGDLEKMAAAGAELIPFDCTRDTRLPDVDGLFIGGGFPESSMELLEQNQSMRGEIRAFIENGGAAYAECGGLMYLARSLTWKSKTCKMAGVIPAKAVMHARPQGRGYVRLKERSESPWPALINQNQVISAHEFHYSALEGLPGNTRFAYDVLRGTGVDGKKDGIIYKNLLASYTHLRDVGGNQWTRRFLAHVERVKGGVN